MKIVKVRDVKTPARGTALSAGIDFFVPNDFVNLNNHSDNTVHVLYPSEAINIPSGIHAKVPAGFVLIVKEKSGVALKKNLAVGACVIDEDYQGEIHLHVINIGCNDVEIRAGEKLVQMILVPCSLEDVDVLGSLAELYPEVSERGSGAFGSTGTK